MVEKVKRQGTVLPASKVLDSERLPDPLNDRQIKKVKAPPNIPLSKERLFPNNCANSEIDVDLVKDYLFERGTLSKECMLEIIQRAKAILTNEANLLRINGKVTICGDIHGQYYDLVSMLRKLKAKHHQTESNSKMLFLGDYVDRGNYGPEVTALLFVMKIKSPNDYFLLRGNHESRDMAEAFDFRD